VDLAFDLAVHGLLLSPQGFPADHERGP